MLNRRPRSSALCWMMAFFTASYHQLLWTPTHQGPKAPSVWCGFPYHILSSNSSNLQLQYIRGPKPPSAWCGFTYHSRLSPSPTVTTNNLTSVLTELYNSSTPSHSPTRSLKSHVWSSSSGNNCHAVHRSLSSGASVYECTMGIFFTSSHFVSQFPPTRFPLITAIRMCHLLPVHHLGMAFLRVEGQNTTHRT